MLLALQYIYAIYIYSIHYASGATIYICHIYIYIFSNHYASGSTIYICHIYIYI